MRAATAERCLLKYVQAVRKMELLVARVRCNLIAHLYTLVTKQGLRLHIFKPDVWFSNSLSVIS